MNLSRAAAVGHLDAVRLAEIDARDARGILDLDTTLASGCQQHVLQAASIELKRRHRREAGRTELESLVDRAVVRRRKEVAEAELLELPLAQMGGESQARAKVVRRDFDRRLTDLERRFGCRMRAALGDEDPQLRRFHPQLSREGEPGKSSAGNDDVVGGVWGHVRGGLLLFRLFRHPRRGRRRRLRVSQGRSAAWA